MYLRLAVCLLAGAVLTHTAAADGGGPPGGVGGGVLPKIFIYDLGEKYHNWTQFGEQVRSPGCFYALDRIFPELLRQSPYWTNNSAEADFFYVDVWMYWPWQDMNEVVGKLQLAGPHWDRKQGADHIFVVSADPGRCQFSHPVARKAIYIHHFGMLQKLNSERCNLFKQWGGECDGLMTAALGAIRGNLQWGCHLPYQDIVVPPSPYEDDIYAENRPLHFPTPYIGKDLIGLNRTHKLYYSGKIDLHVEEPNSRDEPWSDASYSFGARQTVFRMFNLTPGFLIRSSHSHGSYWHDLSSSIFCLAAAGWAWGGRMKVAVTRGCIPVIIQDGIKVEWEEQLPMQDYAVRVPTWLVHKLPDILDLYISSGRVQKMQKVLDCAWRLHWWKRPHGRAFDLVMCELKRRTLGQAPGHIKVDWDKCEISCGDGKPVPLRENYNLV